MEPNFQDKTKMQDRKNMNRGSLDEWKYNRAGEHKIL